MDPMCHLNHFMFFNLENEREHSKVDQTSAPLYESHGFLGQRPISSSKILLKIDYFFMMTSIVKLGTQI